MHFPFCFAILLNYGISSVLWTTVSLKTLLQESSPAQQPCRRERRIVEFAGKLLRIRRERKQRDRCCAAIEHKKKAIRDKHLKESWNWFQSLRVASQGLAHPFLKTFVTACQTRNTAPGSPRMGSGRAITIAIIKTIWTSKEALFTSLYTGNRWKSSPPLVWQCYEQQVIRSAKQGELIKYWERSGMF